MSTVVESGSGEPPEPAKQRLSFSGSGSKYFGIWLTNLLLTIATLGVYSAWAKVRRLRYFRGNTWLDGHAFDFHGRGGRILLGRLIALALLAAFQFATSFGLSFGIAGGGLLLLAAPWLAIASLRFRAHNTSYRGIRFEFQGRYAKAFSAYALWSGLSAVSLGILAPYASRAQQQYSIRRHGWGGRSFDTALRTSELYGAMCVVVFAGLGGGLLAGLGGVFLGLMVEEQGGDLSPEFATCFGFAIGLVAYLPVLWGLLFYRASVWAETVRDAGFDAGRLRFSTDFDPGRMAGIQLTNLFGIVATLGLFAPWAAVRAARYRIESLELTGDLETLDLEGRGAASEAAAGEEIGGFFDLDFGL